MKLVLWEPPELDFKQLVSPANDAKTKLAVASARQGDFLRILFPLKRLWIEPKIQQKTVPKRLTPIVYQEWTAESKRPPSLRLKTLSVFAHRNHRRFRELGGPQGDANLNQQPTFR